MGQYDLNCNRYTRYVVMPIEYAIMPVAGEHALAMSNAKQTRVCGNSDVRHRRS